MSVAVVFIAHSPGGQAERGKTRHSSEYRNCSLTLASHNEHVLYTPQKPTVGPSSLRHESSIGHQYATENILIVAYISFI